MQIKSKTHELYTLEQLSGGTTSIHKLHPLVKLLTTFIYIIIVVSFGKYAFGQLIPYIFYPTLLMALSETPYLVLLKRFLIALPFSIFAGITNLIFNRIEAFAIGNIVITLGVISFFTILFKTYLCVMAVLILVAVTSFSEITKEMRRLKIPSIFIMIFEMIYRYLGILLDEAGSMYTAYSLRSKGKNSLKIKDMGSFIGQLLLRSFDRGERIYNAMKCRGYTLNSSFLNIKKTTLNDWAYFIIVSALCIGFRFFNIYSLFF